MPLDFLHNSEAVILRFSILQSYNYMLLIQRINSYYYTLWKPGTVIHTPVEQTFLYNKSNGFRGITKSVRPGDLHKSPAGGQPRTLLNHLFSQRYLDAAVVRVV